MRSRLGRGNSYSTRSARHEEEEGAGRKPTAVYGASLSDVVALLLTVLCLDSHPLL